MFVIQHLFLGYRVLSRPASVFSKFSMMMMMMMTFTTGRKHRDLKTLLTASILLVYASVVCEMLLLLLFRLFLLRKLTISCVALYSLCYVMLSWSWLKLNSFPVYEYVSEPFVVDSTFWFDRCYTYGVWKYYIGPIGVWRSAVCIRVSC